MKPKLKNGQVCLVRIKGHPHVRRRVFKWMETRFGEIPCYVFTAPIPQSSRSSVEVTWDAAYQSLSISGVRVPRSEVSVPHYDLALCELVINAPENKHTWITP